MAVARSVVRREAGAAGIVEDLDSLARDWLTYWLLDMGAPAASTSSIAGWPRPDFLRMPDLA